MSLLMQLEYMECEFATLYLFRFHHESDGLGIIARTIRWVQEITELGLSIKYTHVCLIHPRLITLFTVRSLLKFKALLQQWVKNDSKRAPSNRIVCMQPVQKLRLAPVVAVIVCMIALKIEAYHHSQAKSIEKGMSQFNQTEAPQIREWESMIGYKRYESVSPLSLSLPLTPLFVSFLYVLFVSFLPLFLSPLSLFFAFSVWTNMCSMASGPRFKRGPSSIHPVLWLHEIINAVSTSCLTLRELTKLVWPSVTRYNCWKNGKLTDSECSSLGIHC